MYIEPPKYRKFSESDSPESMGYNIVEFKYPGEWCILHSNGKRCILQNKHGVVLSEKSDVKFDFVGHYWKWKKKDVYTFFDYFTFDDVK